MALLELLARPAYLAPVVLIFGFIIHHLFLKPSNLPKLPIIGAKDGDWFPLYQARWRTLRNYEKALRETERKHKNETVILPFVGSNVVLLPRSETQFVVDQPENVLSMHARTADNLELDYTIPKPDVAHNAIHHVLIVKNLTKQIGNLIPSIVEEVVWGFDEHWGSDTEYKEICVYETAQRIIGPATNCALVGKPLCRNLEFLDTAMAYAQAVPLTATILRFIWEPIRPLAGFLATIPIHRYARKMEELMLPEIQRRLAADEARQQDPEAHKLMDTEPNDFFQWTMRQAKQMGDLYPWSPTTLTVRIRILNFGALHTTSFAITHALLDLATSKQYIDELRDEVESVLPEHNGE